MDIDWGVILKTKSLVEPPTRASCDIGTKGGLTTLKTPERGFEEVIV